MLMLSQISRVPITIGFSPGTHYIFIHSMTGQKSSQYRFHGLSDIFVFFLQRGAEQNHFSNKCELRGRWNSEIIPCQSLSLLYDQITQNAFLVPFISHSLACNPESGTFFAWSMPRSTSFCSLQLEINTRILDAAIMQLLNSCCAHHCRSELVLPYLNQAVPYWKYRTLTSLSPSSSSWSSLVIITTHKHNHKLPAY